MPDLPVKDTTHGSHFTHIRNHCITKKNPKTVAGRWITLDQTGTTTCARLHRRLWGVLNWNSPAWGVKQTWFGGSCEISNRPFVFNGNRLLDGWCFKALEWSWKWRQYNSGWTMKAFIYLYDCFKQSGGGRNRRVRILPEESSSWKAAVRHGPACVSYVTPPLLTPDSAILPFFLCIL